MEANIAKVHSMASLVPLSDRISVVTRNLCRNKLARNQTQLAKCAVTTSNEAHSSVAATSHVSSLPCTHNPVPPARSQHAPPSVATAYLQLGGDADGTGDSRQKRDQLHGHRDPPGEAVLALKRTATATGISCILV